MNEKLMAEQENLLSLPWRANGKGDIIDCEDWAIASVYSGPETPSKRTERRDFIVTAVNSYHQNMARIASLESGMRFIGAVLSEQWGSAEEGDLTRNQETCFELLEELVPIEGAKNE